MLKSLGPGITGGSDYNRRVEYIIPREEVSKGKCLRYIEVTANGMFGLQPNDQEDVSQSPSQIWS